MKKKTDLELTPDSFSRAPNLRELMAKAQHHARAEQLVIAALPESLAKGTRFVSCKEGELILSAATATNASQIRFRQHEIMEALRKQELFRFVWKLKVKVAPPRFHERPKVKMTPLSNENARLLREEAGHTKDKQLREVLEKLASHVRD
ncbi:DciA family protein [Marinobacter sp. TBZ242]|uniref:DciA family protein n=1 Tax=Marinobacter azerbaijanicus TaxID=3050455 RepID=A0ABT7I996_9GAMM|nr:DciA family protein [Marinobacter sp. TBZ242]MDL0430721.1 DciA family protein [Marinobacter sp. TBZ242]